MTWEPSLFNSWSICLLLIELVTKSKIRIFNRKHVPFQSFSCAYDYTLPDSNIFCDTVYDNYELGMIQSMESCGLPWYLPSLLLALCPRLPVTLLYQFTPEKHLHIHGRSFHPGPRLGHSLITFSYSSQGVGTFKGQRHSSHTLRGASSSRHQCHLFPPARMKTVELLVITVA